MKSTPYLSVIIPCHENANSLSWILKSIVSAKFTDLEVICVDDQSVKDDIKTVANTFGFRYYRLPDDRPGRRAMARNCGHKNAKGEVTLYLDGDIIPEPRLLGYCAQLHQREKEVAIKYPVYSITIPVQKMGLTRLIESIISHNIEFFGPLVTKHVGIDTRPLPKRLRGIRTKLWVLCASHCTSFLRKDIEFANGWDENFKGWGEEDLELAYRLYKRGIDFLYPHRKYGAAYHLDHTVNWQINYKSLMENVRRFRDKHPESWEGRRGILKMFLGENQLPEYPNGGKK
ncbi:MAG: glycosyltransferase family 2 protein [Candidatus Hodarchaeota archaeon]